MKILGIETATSVCSVGLSTEKQFIGETRIHRQGLHAEAIAGMTNCLLNKAGWNVRELDGVGVSIGPGSFTGLRIGLGLAKGLAMGLNRPVIPVPTMNAVLWGLEPEPFRACVLLTSRKNEVYRGLYHWKDNEWTESSSIDILPVEDWTRDLPNEPAYITGEAAGLCVIPSRFTGIKRISTPAAFPGGYGVAALAARQLQRGEVIGEDPVPYYIKRFQGMP
ncbi:MAG TPA: tRNA (adenosine(37)-N6)-threonylcarbamoyltransferase complex dimerization subunit type 1 TsaB [bacterium]|nr:tRNA (adenosine(37)-N6)-threonylcarbamoyltransferase complex dimerization subunit type 1 TsaB [bacterium]